VACDSGAPKKADSAPPALGLVTLVKPAVDASKLRVYGISVAKVKKGEIYLGSLSYEADGQADVVEYKACHENGTCFAGKAAVNRVLMPAFVGGNITITAHACVDPGRSTAQTNCGVDSTGEFIQPANANTSQTELSSQRAQKIEQMRSFGVTVKAVLERFQKESDQCLQDDATNQKILGKKQMVSAFVSMGESLAGIATNYAVQSEYNQDVKDIDTAKRELDPNFVGPVSERTGELQKANVVVAKTDIKRAQSELDPNFVGPVSPRSLELENAGIVNKSDLTQVFNGSQQGANNLNSFVGYSSVVANSAASVGMYQTSPVGGIQSLAMSMFDIFNADDVKLSPCIAEQTAQAEMNAIKAQMQKLQQEIAVIDSRIQPAQTGVVLP
jgi:hypothetical protein